MHAWSELYLSPMHSLLEDFSIYLHDKHTKNFWGQILRHWEHSNEPDFH